MCKRTMIVQSLDLLEQVGHLILSGEVYKWRMKERVAFWPTSDAAFLLHPEILALAFKNAKA